MKYKHILPYQRKSQTVASTLSILLFIAVAFIAL